MMEHVLLRQGMDICSNALSGGEILEDITAPECVEVVIRSDGKVVWVNTEKGCQFQACQIGRLIIDDRRGKTKKKRSPLKHS